MILSFVSGSSQPASGGAESEEKCPTIYQALVIDADISKVPQCQRWGVGETSRYTDRERQRETERDRERQRDPLARSKERHHGMGESASKQRGRLLARVLIQSFLRLTSCPKSTTKIMKNI